MTELDEAVKRLETSVDGYQEASGREADIRTVLDALSDADSSFSAERADKYMAENDAKAWREMYEGALAVIERVRVYAESIPRTRDRDVNLGLSQRSWLTAQDVLHHLNTTPVDALRERDAALLERLAEDIDRECQSMPNWPGRAHDMARIESFAHGIVDAAGFLRAKANELRKEQS